MSQLVFKDGTELSCLGWSDESIRFAAENLDDIWKAVTQKPLSGAVIMSGEERVYIFPDNMIFDGRLLVTESGASAYIREKTEVEILLERIRKLEAAREITDEAITDLGQAISEIAEGGM